MHWRWRCSREDARVLALAIGLKPALQQLKHSLKEMVEPAAVLSMLVWTCVVYLTMWLLPEPVPWARVGPPATGAAQARGAGRALHELVQRLDQLGK